jgi:hypothetical protein
VKLLFIMDSYRNPFAGTEGQLLKLLSGLDQERYQCVMVVFRNSDYLKENAFPVPVNVLDITRMMSPACWVRLFRHFRVMRREGFRLAHVFSMMHHYCPPLLRSGFRSLFHAGIWVLAPASTSCRCVSIRFM